MVECIGNEDFQNREGSDSCIDLVRRKNEIDWVLEKCHLRDKATGPLEARPRGQNTTTEGDCELPLRPVSNSEALPCHKSDRTEGNDQRLEWKLLGCDLEEV